jgi:N-acetyl-1-D-myo-inositol-2-amino-2-deoxy-alpha-D-glucopyranoside deacetylase
MSLPAAGPSPAPDEAGGLLAVHAHPDEADAPIGGLLAVHAHPDDADAPIGGLLAVHAHPDDETLSTGALLATWAAAGLPVTVVTATRGERGEVIPPSLRHLEGDGPALAAHRSGELAAALAALGVTEHAFLDTLPDPAARGARVTHGTRGASDEPLPSHEPHVRRDRAYEDSGMVWVGTARAGAATDVPPGAFVGVPLDEAAGRLAALLRARRPALVVTYDPEGGYGHPDHVRVHEVTMRAVELAAGDGWQPAAWWRRTGRAALAAGYRALPTVRSTPGGPYGELALPDPEGPFPAVAVPDEALEVLVEVAPVRDRVLAALHAHATQVQAVRAVEGDPALVGCYALSDRVLQPLLPDEGYVRVRGPRLSGPAGVRQLP